MFKLDPNPTFPAVVPVSMPDGTSQDLAVTFNHKTKSAVQAFLNGGPDRSNADLVAEMVASVEGKPEGKSDAEFMAALIENYPAATADILRVYLRQLTESRVKN